MRHFLFVVIFILFAFSLCEAAVVSPDLQAVLQAGPSNQEVSIIINLADRVDINQIPIVPANNMPQGKAYRRNAIAASLKDKADQTQGPIMGLLQGRGGRKMKSLWITNSIAVTVPASVVSELSSSPQIASIELDAVIRAPLIEPSTTGTPRWNIGKVNAPALWSVGIDGEGAVVANLDTGVDVNHPDLKYRWRGGACSTPPDCPSWFDPYGNTTLPFGIPATGKSFTELDATHAHGTHTMGIMVGGSASGDAIGVAPGAKWIAAKIFDDSGNADTSVILSAFQWALAPAGNAANAPDVVNNSWTIGGQNTCNTSLLTAISNLTAAGIEIVFAAGNMAITTPPTTSSSSFSPANNLGVFAVGATECHRDPHTSQCDSTNPIASYSALGPSACSDRITNFPNVVAPGSNIYSSVPTGGNFGNYNLFFGTSMAAPHVAGAAALLAGTMPDLTPVQIEEAFEQSALPLGSLVPNDTYGHGLLDVETAYKYAFIHFGKGNVSQIAGPSSLSFINVAASDTAMFHIVNQGTADLTITGISIVGTNLGDFTVTNNSCSSTFPFIIPSLSGCSITVSFTPGAPGRRSAQLSISSDDLSTATLNIPLSGNDPVALVHDSAIVATYSDIQTASNDSSNWDTIRMQAMTLTGTSPVFNLPLGITVSLQGGYDPAFGTQTGSTTIQGTLTFSKGTIIVGNVIVQ